MAAPATLASQAEVLDRIFAGLKDRNPEARLQSAIELQRYVRSAASTPFLWSNAYVKGIEYCTRFIFGFGGEAMG